MLLIHGKTNEEIVLPNDLIWTDEFTWKKVGSTPAYSLKGNLIIQQGIKLGGRTISLAPPDDSMAWVPRSTVKKLLEWSEELAGVFILMFEYPTDKRTFEVHFSPEDECISSQAVKGFADHTEDEWHLISLKFIEV